MTFVYLVPAILAELVLGAHFWRAGDWGLLLSFWAAPLLLLFGQRWSARATQLLLVTGTLVWIVALAEIARTRIAHGEPWIRMALILGGVALFTACAAIALQAKRVLAAFPASSSRSAIPATAAFFVTATLLGIVHITVHPSMLLLERFFPRTGWAEIMGLSVYAAWVTEKMLVPRQSPLWRRRIWGLFAIVFFAQLLLGLAGLSGFLMSGTVHMPVPALIAAGPLYRGEGFFMLILFGATVVAVGPAWCSHLCYIGALDNAMAQRKFRPSALRAWRRRVSVAILFAVAAIALLLRFLGASAATAAAAAGLFGVCGLGLMVFWSRKAGAMTHCVTYCPIGVLATTFGRVSPFRIRIAPSCTDCGACTLACRYDALGKADVLRRQPGASCTLCGDCVGRCKGSSIEYRFARLGPDAARGLFITLAVSLHAAFLGVARL